METTSVLPYRTDSVALAEWLEARARGRSAGQLRSTGGSPKTVEGTAAAAVALALVEAVDGRLTPAGEAFALADAQERPALLRDVLLRYRPYREVLSALAEKGAAQETEMRWVEAFWATRGYGGSESNRREGAAAFGRLAEGAGLGEYIPGRRGRPTRMRWAEGVVTAQAVTTPAGAAANSRPRTPVAQEAPDLFSAVPAPPPPPEPSPPLRATSRPAAAPATVDAPRNTPRNRPDRPVNRITVPLNDEATARLEVPLRLSRAEKRRLLDLLELLISEE